MGQLLLLPLFAILLTLSNTGQAAETAAFTIKIQDHKFTPAEIEVPAGQKVRLTIINEDSSAEEFESEALKREKIVPGQGKAVITISPLTPGRYPFFGEFNPKTAQGVLIAK